MSNRRARILVVEDDRPIRSSLEIALCTEEYLVLARPDATQVESDLASFRPDLAILDVRLPVGPDGYVAARRIRTRSDMPILFLTAADGIADRLAGFDVGADDYLVKPFSMAELLVRVRALLKRAGRLDSTIREVGDVLIDEGARSVLRGGQVLNLTRIEYDLLSVLARHPGQVLTKGQLLTQVWGFDAYDGNLVEVHLSALRRKMEAYGPRLVQTVRGVGYMLRP